MKLSAIIVTYFPDLDELEKNINSCIKDVEKIIIWENTPDSSLKTNERFFKYTNKLIFLGLCENVGIATALNHGVKWSIDNDYTHILTMDQDSCFKGDSLANYLEMIENTRDEKIGVFGINPVCENVPLYDLTNESKIVADTITSGSIFPLSIFKVFDMFMDELFIDAVDYEFCYRIKSKGYKTVVFTDILLEHKVGYVTKTKWGFKTDNYSAFRTYFIVRNQLFVWLMYPKLFPKPHKKILIKNHIIFRIIKVLLAEDDKLQKVKAIVYGFIHGLSKRTGFYKI